MSKKTDPTQTEQVLAKCVQAFVAALIAHTTAMGRARQGSWLGLAPGIGDVVKKLLCCPSVDRPKLVEYLVEAAETYPDPTEDLSA